VHILIVKTSAIGDVTHTLPALEALRRQFPHAQIDWLVEEAAAGLLHGHPALNRVFVSRRRSWAQRLKKGEVFAVLREFVQFIKELRQTQYDLMLDFQGLLKSSLFIVFCRAGRKVGFARGMEHAECSYLFLNEKIPPLSMEVHAVDRELHLLREIGIDTEGIGYHLPIVAQARTQATALLTRHGINPDHPFVAINPMTTWPTKHWQDRKFAELACGILDLHHQVVFTGGSRDAGRIDREILPFAGGEGVANLAGQTDLQTLAALFSMAVAVVSTDTGPMHIAAAVGTPVVALFGPTSPNRTGPYGKGHQIVRMALDCQPCFKKSCALGTTVCMADIAPDRVLAALNHLLPPAR